MERLVMLRLEKWSMVFFKGLPNSSHSSGLLSVHEPWSVREFCKCFGNFCTVWSTGNPGTVLYKPSDIKVFILNCWQSSMAPSLHFRSGVYSTV